MIELNRIYNIDCCEGMKNIPDNYIDLTITSPPYDDLRKYDGYSFNFENTAKELYRVTKNGGTVVWIVSDKTKDGDESGTSFKQALYFKDIGFKLLDTMIWEKPTFTDTGSLRVRYGNVFEYMFIFTKGKQKTFNPIKDRKNKCFGDKKHGTVRQTDGSVKKISSIGKEIQEFGQRFNVWNITPEKNNKSKHPAVLPEQLVLDHIKSWSNENDIVLDCFSGRGTVARCCKKTNRKFIGFEISKNYYDYSIDYINEV